MVNMGLLLRALDQNNRFRATPHAFGCPDRARPVFLLPVRSIRTQHLRGRASDLHRPRQSAAISRDETY